MGSYGGHAGIGQLGGVSLDSERDAVIRIFAEVVVKCLAYLVVLAHELLSRIKSC